MKINQQSIDLTRHRFIQLKKCVSIVLVCVFFPPTNRSSFFYHHNNNAKCVMLYVVVWGFDWRSNYCQCAFTASLGPINCLSLTSAITTNCSNNSNNTIYPVNPTPMSWRVHRIFFVYLSTHNFWDNILDQCNLSSSDPA